MDNDFEKNITCVPSPHVTLQVCAEQEVATPPAPPPHLRGRVSPGRSRWCGAEEGGGAATAATAATPPRLEEEQPAGPQELSCTWVVTWHTAPRQFWVCLRTLGTPPARAKQATRGRIAALIFITIFSD